MANLTREAVDNLSAQILINLGLIHAAALAGALAVSDKFPQEPAPFALGLMGAVFAQSIWYLDAATEHTYPNGMYLSDKAFRLANGLSSLIMVLSAYLSVSCLFYGLMKLLCTNEGVSMSVAVILGFFPLVASLFQAMRHEHRSNHKHDPS